MRPTAIIVAPPNNKERDANENDRELIVHSFFSIVKLRSLVFEIKIGARWEVPLYRHDGVRDG